MLKAPAQSVELLGTGVWSKASGTPVRGRLC